ncbi:alpha-(1-_3)-arabinofuranosyltransferase family protein [Corynebacterium sp. Q4381]|uniref:alpha-(1->3)-arabinofuranosyltransferase domain-containing protein n=1 Tax=Corynebacterium sp. Marseille-Q4381 TaxID=3121597 RepID=UPI002FE660D1
MRQREGAAAHLIGWLALALTAFLQPPGQVAADTKFDLVANPAGFLARATHVWTDEFPLGQMQNQAYGYLFPQGLFFLLADAFRLPDWVAQRLWWTLLLGLAFSGMLVLARRAGVRGTAGPVIAAVLYALSPRILTTLTAISSEAWPVALVPWTLIPLVGKRPNPWAAVIAVALMGAVNAAATIAACLPAFIYLLARRAFADAGRFLAGSVAVSAWWLGPLVILGRYSPPFTEFIESATVTTAWLNPVEILRGATSWSPFVDTERVAGHLLVAEPAFVIATALVAALGLAGLTRAPREFVLMFAVGFTLLGAARWGIPLFDGPLSPFRNLHKFDPLVRLPMCLGVGVVASAAAAGAKRCSPQLVGVVLVSALATAPAWSLRLLPQGTWEEISPDWVAAGEYLDGHAAGTRTLVVPPVQFARQEWGWTRDEPIQGLTTSRFAFRDAVPLVAPEAIRGLDGQTDVVDAEALRSIGVGAVVVRRDLADQQPTPPLGVPDKSFGDVDVFLIDPARDMMVTSDTPLLIDGGGEVLPLLWRELGYFPAQLVSASAGERVDVVTDAPSLSKRNYGALRGQSAQLADLSEDDTVSNRQADYPSAGTRVGVAVTGGSASASSSAADAGAFGGPDPAKSLTSAFDGLDDTAWWPAPGDRAPSITLAPETPTGTIAITATDTTRVVVEDGGSSRTVTLVGGEPRTVTVPEGPITVRLTERVGITGIDAGIRRIVDVPGVGDAYFFQRHFPATDHITRRFTTAADAEWELSAPADIDGQPREGTVFLPAGTHELTTRADTILLTNRPLDLPEWAPFDPSHVAPAGTDRIITTTRGYNPGLRARVGSTELEPTLIDAAAQSFRLPSHVHGEFHMWHTAERAYRAALFFGGAFSLLATAACLWVPWRRFEPRRPEVSRGSPAAAAAAVAVNPLAGIPALAIAFAVRRYTLIPASWLAGGAMTAAGLWLARAPWPAANYAGDSYLLAFAGCLAVAALLPAGTGKR